MGVLLASRLFCLSPGKLEPGHNCSYKAPICPSVELARLHLGSKYSEGLVRSYPGFSSRSWLQKGGMKRAKPGTAWEGGFWFWVWSSGGLEFWVSHVGLWAFEVWGLEL